MSPRLFGSLTLCLCSTVAWSQQGSSPGATPDPAGAAAKAPPDPIVIMVGRLELGRYKATIKSLTQFGDRRQGTDRNRNAIDWIEAQLKSYGCTNTERIHFDYEPPAAGAGRGGANNNDPIIGPGGSRRRGYRIPEGVNNDPLQQPDLKLRELNSQPSTPGPLLGAKRSTVQR